MTEIIHRLSSVNFLQHVGVDDFADKLSFLLTPALLSVWCSLVSIRTYIMLPLACYMPVRFTQSKGLATYVNNYCWTEGTYAVPLQEFHINESETDGGLSQYASKKIGYYQWIPFLLALQAVLCYLPRVIWHLVSFDKAGTDLGRIIESAKSASSQDSGPAHDKLITHVCRMIKNLLRRPRHQQIGSELHAQQQQCSGNWLQVQICRLRRFALALLPAKLFASRLILFYFIVKGLYLLNAVGQLALLQQFLGPESNSGASVFGWSILVNNNSWQSTMYFPRVGCCAMYFRTGAKGEWMVAQCSLPVNMINEKLFIFLWFWFAFLIAGTTASVCSWLWRLSHSVLLARFVRNYIKLADNYAELRNYPKLIHSFASDFIGKDGAFLLRMISLNCGDVVCSEIVHQLWQDFKQREGSGQENGQNFKRSEGVLCLSCLEIDASSPQQEGET